MIFQSFMWYNNVGITFFVLSQITRLTDGQTDIRRTDRLLVAKL